VVVASLGASQGQIAGVAGGRREEAALGVESGQAQGPGVWRRAVAEQQTQGPAEHQRNAGAGRASEECRGRSSSRGIGGSRRRRGIGGSRGLVGGGRDSGLGVARESGVAFPETPHGSRVLDN
jgi:hypothetical protein